MSPAMRTVARHSIKVDLRRRPPSTQHDHQDGKRHDREVHPNYEYGRIVTARVDDIPQPQSLGCRNRRILHIVWSLVFLWIVVCQRNQVISMESKPLFRVDYVKELSSFELPMMERNHETRERGEYRKDAGTCCGEDVVELYIDGDKAGPKHCLYLQRPPSLIPRVVMISPRLIHRRSHAFFSGLVFYALHIGSPDPARWSLSIARSIRTVDSRLQQRRGRRWTALGSFRGDPRGAGRPTEPLLRTGW